MRLLNQKALPSSMAEGVPSMQSVSFYEHPVPHGISIVQRNI
jgi:hypothetical protein